MPNFQLLILLFLLILLLLFITFFFACFVRGITLFNNFLAEHQKQPDEYSVIMQKEKKPHTLYPHRSRVRERATESKKFSPPKNTPSYFIRSYKIDFERLTKYLLETLQFRLFCLMPTFDPYTHKRVREKDAHQPHNRQATSI